MIPEQKPNLAFRILKWISGARILPKNNYLRFINGIGWILEAQFENWIAGVIVSRYLWEIVGPVNVGLFASELMATIYGTISLFFSLVRFAKWFSKKYQVAKV